MKYLLFLSTFIFVIKQYYTLKCYNSFIIDKNKNPRALNCATRTNNCITVLRKGFNGYYPITHCDEGKLCSKRKLLETDNGRKKFFNNYFKELENMRKNLADTLPKENFKKYENEIKKMKKSYNDLKVKCCTTNHCNYKPPK